MTLRWLDVEDLADPSSPFAYDAVLTASFVLWSLSGRKYSGRRIVTEKYECGWKAAYTRDCITFTPRPKTNSVRLRGFPARRVIGLSVGGGDLASGQYVLENWSLIRPAPDETWRVCDGIEITYEYGSWPPVAGRRAAIELANELVLGYSGSDDCKLPANVTSVQREGMSFDILTTDPQDFVNEGRTGLARVDMFIRAANPARAKVPPRVLSPDSARGRRVG